MPWFILFAIFFNFTAVAMEKEQGGRVFHEAYFKEEFLQFSKEQFENLEASLAARINADQQPKPPLPKSFRFSSYIPTAINDNDRLEIIPLPELENAKQDLFGLAPFFIMMTLPQIATTMGYVSIKYIFDGIKKKDLAESFYRHMSLNLYHWINFVKLGRQAIIDELRGNKNLLIDHKLAFFDADTNKALLDFIDSALLHYEENWKELSQQIKIPFDYRQMIHIKARLSSLAKIYGEMADFSIEDMDKYLDFALYCFVISKEHHLLAAKKFAGSDIYFRQYPAH
jgi:hypothetical protein